MIDDHTLHRLRSQPIEVLANSLEELHGSRRQNQLPPGLRSGDNRPAPEPTLESWLSLLQVTPPSRVATQVDIPAPSREEGPQPDPKTGSERPQPSEPDLASSLRSLLGQYEGLLQRYNEDFDRLFQRGGAPQPDGAVVAASPEDSESTAVIVERLKRAQLLFFKFPIAAQAAFAAFVEEGRRYARTVEGQRWKRTLEPSTLLESVRAISGGLSLGALREQPNAVIPSAIVDLLVSAAARNDLSSLLDAALGQGERK